MLLILLKISSSVKCEAELSASAIEQKQKGKKDLAQFKESRRYSSSNMKDASSTLQRRKWSEMELMDLRQLVGNAK